MRRLAPPFNASTHSVVSRYRIEPPPNSTLRASFRHLELAIASWAEQARLAS
jgi:hypothetical protein